MLIDYAVQDLRVLVFIVKEANKQGIPVINKVYL